MFANTQGKYSKILRGITQGNYSGEVFRGSTQGKYSGELFRGIIQGKYSGEVLRGTQRKYSGNSPVCEVKEFKEHKEVLVLCVQILHLVQVHMHLTLHLGCMLCY
jgi:hypothetical protein